MADVAAQVTLFEEPDDYVIDNNPAVTYTKVLDKFDFNRFQDEEKLYYQALSDFNRKLVNKLKAKRKQQQHHHQPATKAAAYQELLFEMVEQQPAKKGHLVRDSVHRYG